MAHHYLIRTLAVALAVGGLSPAIYGDECSIAKTNKSCTLTLDRRNPLAPPAIQMYPGQQLTVALENPYFFERYSLDYSSGQVTLNPDVVSSIANGILPSLKGIGEFRNMLDLTFRAGRPTPPPDHCTADYITAHIPRSPDDINSETDQLLIGCLAAFADRSRQLYLKLEPAVAPDSHPQGTPVPVPDQSTLNGYADTDIPQLLDREMALSVAINATSKNFDTVSPSGVQTLPPDKAKLVRNWVALSAVADTVAKDLAGYAARITDLKLHPIGGTVACGTATCVNLQAIGDPAVDHAKMVVRQVTYNVDALNLVQNTQEGIPDPAKKRIIAAVTVVYGDTRWEVSAGTFFSTLANRSFSISPVITNGVVTSKQVTETVLHPTVVPFGAANVRLSNDFQTPQWRMAAYWTFAVGINPNTVSTDFATGPSLSWRGLMFSALWHVGHDVRLTQGLYKNQILDPSYSGGATTQNYWRLDRIALGISVRVPSLTGR